MKVILNQLINGYRNSNLPKLYLIAYSLKKIILIKNKYKIPNNNLLAIVEVFKTW